MFTVFNEYKEIYEMLKNDPEFQKDVKELVEKYAKKYNVGNMALITVAITTLIGALLYFILKGHLIAAAVAAGADQNAINSVVAILDPVITLVAVLTLGTVGFAMIKMFR